MIIRITIFLDIVSLKPFERPSSDNHKYDPVPRIGLVLLKPTTPEDCDPG